LTTWIGFIVVFSLVFKDFYQGVLPRDLDSLQDPWGLVGLAVVLTGIFIRSWAAGVIHKTETLTTTGPYALARHPLYIGSLLIAIGFFIIISGPLDVLIIAGTLIPLHVRKARREERKLSAKFGEEWQAYCQRTGPFCPKQIPASVLGGWSVTQWAHNKEFGALLTGLIALVVMELWHEFPTVSQHLRACLG
jgi:protein-S-isoprenylcysteine O-methyltransferase Ste14